jgi:hypothetical protein
VIPFPGTPDAAPASEIIFSTLARSDVVWVAVMGSRSGRHAGRWITLPDSAGIAFLPRRPFQAGEMVQVQAELASPAAGAAAGDGGVRLLKWSFVVGIRESPNAATDPAPRRDGVAQAGAAASAAAAIRAGGHAGEGSAEPAGDGRSAGPPTQTFNSRPDLHPPLVSLTHDGDPDAGDIFLTPNHNPQRGAMILDGRGRLVWFEPRHGPVYNLEVQTYRGQHVLTWWEGQFMGPGRDVIMNQSYRRVAVVHAGEGYSADLHEFQITPQGTALVDVYSPVRTNLSSIGGSARGTAVDGVIQELDIRTGRVLWEWHALGHIPISASHAPVPKDSSPFDYFHINSIQQLPNGNLLISSRSAWAVYEINKRTGNVIWELGGKHPSFTMGPMTNFEWQHDAHMYPDDTLTLFDDAGSPQEERQSSAKTLFVNLRARTVSLIHRFAHSPSLLSSLAGSAQRLPDHNVLVGWGSEPAFSEYTPAGQLLFDGRFPYGVYTYRVYRFPWTGHPLTRPAVAVTAAPGGGTTVYASWNGANQVAFWRVLAGSSASHLTALGNQVAWSGFETAISRRARPAYLAVQALDSSGHVLGTSTVHRGPSGG